ncbi:hypothetical protein [Cetobacterium sp.]|uniref:hypothetical protein n=1 Tax=Cetobacterium sp. TaxID=2071632 RepID=UPI003F677456
MVASSGLVIDPRVYVNGELVAPSGYTIDYNSATITLTEPVKYSAIFFIDDTYAPKFKFSVSTVNFLVNAPTLKEKLALGDVIDIQGESDAYDGGHHVRVVESASKLNGVDLGGGLFLNEVPNSRISDLKSKVDENGAKITSMAPVHGSFVTPSSGYVSAIGQNYISNGVATLSIGTPGIDTPAVGTVIGKSTKLPHANILAIFVMSGLGGDNLVGTGSVTLTPNGDIIISELYTASPRVGFHATISFVYV